MFKKLANRLIRWAQSYDDNMSIKLAVADRHDRVSSKLDSDTALRFSVHRADNGFVIETKRYDNTTDRVFGGLHIVSDNEDIGQAIGHILTLESIKMMH